KERADFENQLVDDEQLNLELEAQSLIYDLTSERNTLVFNTEAAWTIVNRRTTATRVVRLERPRYSLLKIAAALLVIAVAGFLVINNKVQIIPTDTDSIEFTSSANSFKEYSLPDGSIVKLNANSSLKIASDFGDSNRTVTLVGEANFDVVRNENLPFIILAGNSRVKVLGTSFNLTSYLDNDIELNVTEGNVEFSSVKNEGVKEQVSKGEMAKMDKEGQFIRKDLIKNINYSGWWTRKFEFENTILSEVIENLEDAYWVEIEYTKEIGNCPVTGTYENKSIKEIIDLIDITFPNIEVKSFKENRIILDGKKCTN
ncbi:MAG: ferric-dicitrate binding protein FerR (iron transport regulator), partial [Roseivirga sp.]